MTLPQVPILPILPELILTLFGIAVMLFDPFTAKSHKSWLSTLAFIGVLAALGGVLRHEVRRKKRQVGRGKDDS